MGKCLFMRKGETHTEPKVGLPSGYTELTYIQSSGTQYVDTEFKPNNNTRIVMDADLLDYSTNTYGNSILGVRNSDGSAAFALICGKAETATWTIMYGNASGNVTQKALGQHNIDFNKNVCSVDETSATLTANTFSSSYNCFLFTDNKGGSANTVNNSRMKLYSCQIYDNGTKVRDFLPCINPSGEIGLYDTVNKKFYGNKGTGTFIGSEVA